MNIEPRLVNNFEDVLEIARVEKVEIQEGEYISRAPGFGKEIKLPNDYEGVLVNVRNDGVEQGICIESLSEDKKQIIGRYYRFFKGEFELIRETKYSLDVNGTNINLRKNIWRLNKNKTISRILKI
jgi:hypothetical protein